MHTAGKHGSQFERRLVTLVAADVSDYCRLMSQDDEATLSQLLSYRQTLATIVASGGGRMFGVAGDSWMAEFPDAVEAVQCAANCQRSIEVRNAEFAELKRIRFRIGIHRGDAIAEAGHLFGEAVNIAARLQQLCRPGQLVISDAVFQQVRGKVDLSFEPMGAQRLRNISDAISAFTANIIEAPEASAPPNYPIAGPDVSKGSDGKPAIAVLPFETLDGGGDDLGEGFAEDLVNGLSNLRWFPVISRRSSFNFGNRNLDAASIGRALGATYLVTGSVRIAEKQFWLTVNLVWAADGRNLWSQGRQFEVGAPCETRHENIASIVSILEAEVERAEGLRLRTRKAEDLDPWELVRRGARYLNRWTSEDAATSRAFLEEALRRDPGSSEARVQLAWGHFWDVWMNSGDGAGFGACESLAREAAIIDPRDARAHFLVGVAVMMTGRPEQSRVHFQAAIDLNPSLAAAHACAGVSRILAGEPEKAIEPLLLAIRLNPQDPFNFHYWGGLAFVSYMQKDWLKACEFAERSLQISPDYWFANAVCIASLAQSGRIESAQEMLTRAPVEFSVEQIARLPFVDKTWNQALVEGLQLAGCLLR
jgi:class 3 adenylate cyclase/TolB-like protein